MHRRIVVALALLIAGAATAQAEDAPGSVPEPLKVEESQLFVVFAAHFYCERNRWPVDLPELLDYRDAVHLLPNVSLPRERALGAIVSYRSEPTFLIRVAAVLKKKGGDRPVEIEATQEPPKCRGKDIILRGAAMHLKFADEPEPGKPGV